MKVYSITNDLSAGNSCADPRVGPQPCSSGHYALQGVNIACTSCPAGSFCSLTTSSPSACQPGTYSVANAVACTSCPAGSSCASTSTVPSPCAAGSYSSLGSGVCLPCQSGFQCSNPSVAPVACLGLLTSIFTTFINEHFCASSWDLC